MGCGFAVRSDIVVIAKTAFSMSGDRFTKQTTLKCVAQTVKVRLMRSGTLL